MANSEGGLIIYGMGEDNGKAKSIEWIDSSLRFEERIESIIATTINPVIPFRIFPISKKDESTKSAYIVFIPKSHNLHMVIKGNDNRYYKRSGKTIHKMEDSEIKERIKTIQASSQNIEIIISSLNSEFRQFCINLASIQRINYYVVPDELNDKVKTIDGLNLAVKDIFGSISQGRYINSYKSTVTNVIFTDQRKWHRSTIVHRNGIIEFRRSHAYAEFFNSSAEATHLLELIKYANQFYGKIAYFGGYKIYMEIGNVGNQVFSDDMMGNSKGLYHYSLGELKDFVQIDPIIVQNENSNKLKILELIKIVGGTIELSEEEAYLNAKKALGLIVD